MSGLLSRRDESEIDPPAQPSGRQWLQVLWEMLKIGAIAFGGGSATTFALRKASLRRGWLTEDEFLDTVVLSRLTPGITILAQVILIGKHVCGWRGIIAGLAGMLAPAVVITIALTKIYQIVSASPAAAAPLRCVAGAAAGFAVALCLQLLRDTLARSPRIRGPLIFLAYVGLALLIDNVEIFLVVAIALGVGVPRLFEKPETDSRTATVGSAPADEPEGVGDGR